MSGSQSFNIAAHLPAMAAKQPTTVAVHFPYKRNKNNQPLYQSLTYAELEQQSNRTAAGLESIGIKRGVRTVLMVKPSLDFFALTFALFKVGAVPILIDPGMGVKNLKVCLEEAEPEAFIGIPKAQVARLLLGWGKASLKIILTIGPRLFWGGTNLEKMIAPIAKSHHFETVNTEKSETAAILFTSGSTGVPKGAVYSHGNFIAQVDALKHAYQITSGEVDLPTFPLFALFAPALGMTSVIPEMDFTRPGAVDPENIINAIKRFNATTMFGSPALIRRVGLYGEKQGVKLPSLKRVISAGAPVPARELERFTLMLNPGVQIFTPYGATESLPVCSIGSEMILHETRFATEQGRGVCVGHPVDNIQLEIIDINDDEISSWQENLKTPDGEIGEIVVKGPQVTRSYFNRPDSTRLAKIPVAGGDDFFHRMGDLGYRDQQGRIWFCGRKAHRVVTPQGTLFTIPCEAIFNHHNDVFRSALVVAVGPDGEQQPVICVETEQKLNRAEQKRLIAELKEIAKNHVMTKNIEHFLIHPGFPVDIRHNAKIFREKLSLWANERML
ncbi:Acyl-CoA synthetase (AMP-forming)/AMP-acid ligase II [Desulfuromusa kysingii]|uniref:Acyl-CoA synthetase (AMP-forming)/AMP-acid ligase II n=1 Tax=Desulfuromusa kysingii TaxID=37625 RepID=A0A1H4DP21_9BACT|nr:fatty acid CoA ligase family protein [Desulfuromusa kysingii]SEA74521.1 Acyl-CoA synthetase (AMP-forming)/AMP-acid ligase II [Desulfuromusa kysingii]